MPHVNPTAIADDAGYAAALDELEDLIHRAPGGAGTARLEELANLIEEYEARRDGYDLARMKRALADPG